MPTKRKLPAQMRGDTATIRLKFSDIETVCDGAATLSAPAKITSATAGFASDNLDQPITLKGAGASGADYEGKVTAISSATEVVICPSIKTSVSGAELTFGSAVDITGDTLTLTLKTSNDDPDPGALQVSAVMPANAESVAGVGFVIAGSDETALLAPGLYFYDLQRSIPGIPKVVSTPIFGTIEILEDTTITA